MQPRAAEDIECPGRTQPGQNKKEQPKQNDSEMRGKGTRCPRQEHLGRNKQQGPRPPGQDHPGISGGQTPPTGAGGSEQGAWAAAPRTGSCGDKRQPNQGQEHRPETVS